MAVLIALAVLGELLVAGGMLFKRDEIGGITALDLVAFKIPRQALFATGALRGGEWETGLQTRLAMGLASRVSHYKNPVVER